MDRAVPVLLSLCAAALGSAPALAQQQEPAKPVFKNGEAQVVPAFARAKEWIRHDLWVDFPVRSPG